MKSFAFVLALVALSVCSAEDDGQYRPQQYGGDDGQYHEGYAGKYANGKYNSILAAYQPVYYKTYSPYQQQLLTPYVTYGDHSASDQYPFPSTVSTVTYRPPVLPVVSTVAPIVYSSTARPILEIKPAEPVVHSVVQPVVQPLQSFVQVPVYRTQYNGDANARVVKQETDIEPNAYHYAFQTDNGIAAEEAGTAALGKAGTSARGFYEYIGDDGLKYRVDYTADENGYRASGAHLPKA